MPDQKGIASGRAQIALEFVIVYSFVLVLFVLMFTLISTQRAATMSQQEYSLLQLQSQNIADYIDQAIGAGSGYAATIPLAGSIGAQQFNISISTTGVVIAQTKVGSQIIRAFAFSNARNLLINGTPTQSGNGITVYLVPIQSGSVSLANSNGAIYVDQQPPPTLTLVKSLAATQVASTRVASFNGQSGSYISLPTINSLEPTSVTLSMWFYESSVWPSNYVENGCTGIACYDMILDHGYVDWNILAGASRYQISYTPTFAGNWYFLTGTFDGSNMHFYVNGKEVSGSPISATLSYSSPSFAIGKPAPGSVSPYSISDVQIYNTALTANQIASLYASGISGAPIASANTVGWWPLNGNTKDYGGYNDTGSPTGMGYNSVAQINTQVQYGTGANAISAPLGFVTSSGILGTMGRKQVLYTNATGRQTAFISSNGFNGIANLTISAFNDNLTTVGNLIAWYPLNEGYGSIVYDLSGKYAEGGFISPSWTTFANQTDFAAASFNGVSSYITAGTTGLPTGSAARSASAWIYWTGTGSFVDPFVYGSCSPQQLSGMAISSNLLTFIAGGTNPQSAFTVSPNTWHFIGYSYPAGSKLVTVYFDGQSQTINAYDGANALATGNTATMIGTAGFGGCNNPFPGLISNLQIYSTALSPSQLTQIYQEGISGSPIGDAGLSSWWPLSYDSKDYSNNMNNGISTNVVYNNINYIPPAKTGTTKVPYFNGANSCILTTTTSITANSETQIAWVYLQSLPAQGSYAQITYQVAGIGGLYVDSGGYPLFGATLGSTSNAVGLPVSMGVNQWHMLSGTYSGSAISICMDSTTCLTTPASGALASSAYAFYIGSLQGSSRFTNGEIADVQVYNSALTQAQIQQAYQQGLPPYGKLNISLG